MHIKFQENNQLPNDLIVIEAKIIGEDIKHLTDKIQNYMDEQSVIWIRHSKTVQPIAIQEIYRVFIENRKVIMRMDTKKFVINERLYQIQEKLPYHFVKISQSECINSLLISCFELQKNGLIKIKMKNGDITYSSRRYLSHIKERFGL